MTMNKLPSQILEVALVPVGFGSDNTVSTVQVKATKSYYLLNGRRFYKALDPTRPSLLATARNQRYKHVDAELHWIGSNYVQFLLTKQKRQDFESKVDQLVRGKLTPAQYDRIGAIFGISLEKPVHWPADSSAAFYRLKDQCFYKRDHTGVFILIGQQWQPYVNQALVPGGMGWVSRYFGVPSHV